MSIDLDAIQIRDELATKGVRGIETKDQIIADRKALLAYVRDLEARIGRVEKLLDEKYKLWAAICGNTCSKDIVGVDHDAIADEVSDAIRAALTASDAS